MISEMENGHGRLLEVFHNLRDDVSLEFLNTIVNVHNDLVKRMSNDEGGGETTKQSTTADDKKCNNTISDI